MNNNNDLAFKAASRIAVWLAVGIAACHGQTISFMLPPAPGLNAAVAADPTGIYLVDTNSLTYSPSVAGHFTLHKYDADGKEQWTGTSDGPEVASGLATIPGGLYLAGLTGGAFPGQSSAGGIDAFVRRYDADGNPLWTRQFGTDTADYVNAVVADASGVYVAYSTWVFARQNYASYLCKYDPAGVLLWSLQVASPFNLVADGAGIYASGYTGPNGQNWINGEVPLPFLRRYSTGGVELWTRSVTAAGGEGAYGAAVVASDSGGAYVLVSDGLSARAFLRKYTADGGQLWTSPLGGLLVNPETPNAAPNRAVAVDNSGVYVAGSAIEPLPGQCYAGQGDAVVRKYDVDGNELWTRQFGTSDPDSAVSVAVNDSGIFVAGSRDGANPAHYLAKLVTAPALADTSKPRILDECVVNTASNIGGGVAPGEIVTILGSAMGPAQLTPAAPADGRFGTTLAGVRVLFNGMPAPLLWVSDRQIVAAVPFELDEASSADVQVEFQGVASDIVTVPVLTDRLGVFSADSSGNGQAAVVNQDGSINSPMNPAAPGSFVSIFGTGGGAMNPAALDGVIAVEPIPTLKSTVTLAISDDMTAYPEVDGGDEDYRYYAPVPFAGAAPGLAAGLLQINFQIPPGVKPGSAVPLHIRMEWPLIEQALTIAIGK
jgi:uncharacterized protein (TIGR03437 family)